MSIIAYDFYAERPDTDFDGHIVFIPQTHTWAVIKDGLPHFKTGIPYPCASFTKGEKPTKVIILGEFIFDTFLKWYEQEYDVISLGQKMTKQQIASFLETFPAGSVRFLDMEDVAKMEYSEAEKLARQFLSNGRFKVRRNTFQHYKNRMRDDKQLSEKIILSCMEAMGYRTVFVK